MLEGLVRPFTSPGVISTQKLVPSPATTQKKAQLKWGAVGTLPKPQASATTVTFCNETSSEKKRAEDKVKIIDPNDSTQFIEVGRITQLSLDKTEKTHDISSSLTADINYAFDAFSAEIAANFKTDDGSTSNRCKMTWKFTPPKV